MATCLWDVVGNSEGCSLTAIDVKQHVNNGVSKINITSILVAVENAKT
jgi:hypothetical protein